MKILVMLSLAALFVVGGCSGGGSDGKSVTTSAKVDEDGSQIVTTSQ